MIFRNIHKSLLIAILGLAGFSETARAEDGFKPIFDGKTLTEWDADPKFWKVEDGAIVGKSTDKNTPENNTYCIWRAGEVDDFELTLEYRIFGGNSGVQYRSFDVPENGKWALGGYQADLEAGDTYTGNLWSERDRGILAERGQKTVVGEDHKPKQVGEVGDPDELQEEIGKEDWNKYRIVARGYNFIQEINGKVMSDVTDEDKAVRRRGGPLCLQLHQGPPMEVQFRNIQLKRLPMENTKKVVLIAGSPSHGYMEHEHYAGLRLLATAINAHAPGVYATVYRNGWPTDPTAFDNADAVVMFSDGGEKSMACEHIKELDALAKRGLGIGCLHYSVEVPKGEPGDHMLDWIGGYFEQGWSVNPFWKADFKSLPEHPITRGVKPFSINDEWYFHMRFRKDMEGVTPILTAIPPDEASKGPDGPYSGNKAVRDEAGKPQHVAWAYERKDGGRGFGFTGGHYNYNWAQNNMRKLVLNALVWLAKGEVPKEGVESPTPKMEELQKNLDKPKPADFDMDKISKTVEELNK